MSKRDTAIGLAMMGIAAVFLALTWTFPASGGYVSPRVFPRFVSICMLVLAAMLVWQNAVAYQRTRSRRHDAPATDAGPAVRKFLSEYLAFFALVAICFAYVWLIDKVGYLVGTVFLIPAAVLLFKERRWYVVASVAILGTGVFYYVFRIIFKVPLPRFDLF